MSKYAKVPGYGLAVRAMGDLQGDAGLAGIAGTTRHLDAVRESIAYHMGPEPDLPQWAEISNDTIAAELGSYWAGEYPDAKTAMDAIAASG